MELQTIATHLFAFMIGTLVALIAYTLMSVNIFNNSKKEDK